MVNLKFKEIKRIVKNQTEKRGQLRIMKKAS